MKRLILFMSVALALIAIPLRAAAQPVHADSPKATLTIARDLVVGTTILQPGEYKFQCRTFDGKTFLVVTDVESGKELTRVPCVRESLDAKVTSSEIRTIVGADGKATLTVVRIKGELVSHRVAN
jgi:hypothetical protein